MTNQITWTLEFASFGNTPFLQEAKTLVEKYHSLPEGEKPTKILVNGNGIGDAAAEVLKAKGLPIEVFRTLKSAASV